VSTQLPEGVIAAHQINGVKHYLVKGPPGYFVLTPALLIGPGFVSPVRLDTGELIPEQTFPIDAGRPYGAVQGSYWYRVRWDKKARQRLVPRPLHKLGDTVLLDKKQYVVIGCDNDGRPILRPMISIKVD
jgi:hypothetical protein